MICPNCHEKITSITADQLWNGSAYLDSDGEIEIEQESCITPPTYYCGECGMFLTKDDEVAKKALEEAEE